MKGLSSHCHKIDIKEGTIYPTSEKRPAELDGMQPRENVDEHILSRHFRDFYILILALDCA